MSGCPRGFDTCPLVLLAGIPEVVLENRHGKWECLSVDVVTFSVIHGCGSTAEAAILDRVEEIEATAAKR